MKKNTLLLRQAGFSLISVMIGLSTATTLGMVVSEMMVSTHKSQKGVMALSDLTQTYSTVSNIINNKSLCQHSGLISTVVNTATTTGIPVTLHFPENGAVGPVYLAEGQAVAGSNLKVQKLKLGHFSSAGPASTPGHTLYFAKLETEILKPSDAYGAPLSVRDFSLQIAVNDTTNEISECIGTSDAGMACDWNGPKGNPGEMGAVCNNGKVTMLSSNLYLADTCQITFPKGYRVRLNTHTDGTATVIADHGVSPFENHNEWVGTIQNTKVDEFKKHLCPLGDFTGNQFGWGWSPDQHCWTAQIGDVTTVNRNSHSIELKFNSNTQKWRVIARGKTNNSNHPKYSAQACNAGGFNPNL